MVIVGKTMGLYDVKACSYKEDCDSLLLSCILIEVEHLEIMRQLRKCRVCHISAKCCHKTWKPRDYKLKDWK